MSHIEDWIDVVSIEEHHSTLSDLLDIRMEDILCLPETSGKESGLDMLDIDTLLSGAPVIPTDTGEGMAIHGTTEVVDLLSEACRVANVDFEVIDRNEMLDLPKQTISGINLLAGPEVRLTSPSTVASLSESSDSPACVFHETPDERGISLEHRLSEPSSSDVSTRMSSSPSSMSSASPASSESSGYNSFSSGGDPIISDSEADWPMPASPSLTLFDEPMADDTEKEAAAANVKIPVKKPTDNYIALIGKSLLSASGKRIILADIITYILDNFPYYRTAPVTWKNAIRHNLSINSCFIKNGRSDSGRGYHWSIHPACVETFQKGDFRRSNARRLVQTMEKAKRELTKRISNPQVHSGTSITSQATAMPANMTTSAPVMMSSFSQVLPFQTGSKAQQPGPYYHQDQGYGQKYPGIASPYYSAGYGYPASQPQYSSYGYQQSHSTAYIAQQAYGQQLTSGSSYANYSSLHRDNSLASYHHQY